MVKGQNADVLFIGFLSNNGYQVMQDIGDRINCITKEFVTSQSAIVNHLFFLFIGH